ncbi:MAG: D-2-hydroxyacid dehydrogenase [Thermomicrobiales bacterium]
MKIVIGAERPNRMFDPLVAEFPEVEFVKPTNAEEERAAMRDADAYLGRIGAESFEAAGPSLRWVHSSGAGIETMAAIRDLVDSDVTMTNMRGAHGRCIAEHAFAMLLSLTRQLVPLMENQRQHKWDATNVRGTMRELTGNTMVVLGMGTIGSTIARRGAAFEMRVIGVDMQTVEPPPGVEAVWPLERLDEALGIADVVVVATPQTHLTRGLMDARRINLIKRDAFLIVISRGKIIDEAALIASLKEGRLAGAGLDVQYTEPLPPDDPLWGAPNIIITPHCSASSEQTRLRTLAIARENLRRFVANEPLTNVCDKRAGF